MYIYYNENGEVKMLSNGKLEAPNFKYIKKTLTKKDKDNFKDINYEKNVKGGKLKLTKN